MIMKAPICDNCKNIVTLESCIEIDIQQQQSSWASHHNFDFCSKKCCLEYLEKYIRIKPIGEKKHED